MKDFTTKFTTNLEEEVRKKLDTFFSENLISPEQHPDWQNILSNEQPTYFIGYSKNRIVSYCLINNTKGWIRIFKGPICKDPDLASESIIAIVQHYRNKGGLLSIQLGDEVSPFTEHLLYNLSKKLRFKQSYNKETWSSLFIDLTFSEDELMSNMQANHRQSIK